MITIILIAWVVATCLLAFLGTSGIRRAFLIAILPTALLGAIWVMVSIWTGPKPYRFEHWQGEVVMLAREFHEGHAIHVWVRREDGDGTPKAYSFPWSEELAQEIEKAESDVEGEGGEVRMEFQGSGDIDSDAPDDGEEASQIPWATMFSLEDRNPPVVYAVPQPKPEPKPRPGAENPVIDFNRGRGWGQ